MFENENGCKTRSNTWVFPKIGVPQNGWFLMENPIKMDDLGDTTIFGNPHMCTTQQTVRSAATARLFSGPHKVLPQFRVCRLGSATLGGKPRNFTYIPNMMIWKMYLRLQIWQFWVSMWNFWGEFNNLQLVGHFTGWLPKRKPCR